MSTINKLILSPSRCKIEDQYELNDLDRDEKDFYLYKDPTKQIYKNLPYSVSPDLEPQYNFDLI